MKLRFYKNLEINEMKSEIGPPLVIYNFLFSTKKTITLLKYLHCTFDLIIKRKFMKTFTISES